MENHRCYKVLIPEVDELSKEWESGRMSILSANSSHSQDLGQKI
jgi:hypothetical protein